MANESKTSEHHSGSATVTVNILDVNDNWPEFEDSEYAAAIDENSPNGTVVTTITVRSSQSQHVHMNLLL